MNYRLTLQYDGTDFHGWQMQEAGSEQRTVQGDLTRVLSLLDKRPVVVHGSGRTDAGVHAEGQVASVNLEREIAPWKLRAALNANLARDVRVLAVEPESDEFHARYSAHSKTYCYRVINGPVMSPFWFRYACHEARSLDVERMRDAASLFIGRHDWTAFSSAQSDVVTRVRTMTRLEVRVTENIRARAVMLEITASANGFLRHMVRAICGTLLGAGRGEIGSGTIATAIRSGDRSLAGATAPARGLTLVEVHYD